MRKKRRGKQRAVEMRREGQDVSLKRVRTYMRMNQCMQMEGGAAGRVGEWVGLVLDRSGRRGTGTCERARAGTLCGAMVAPALTLLATLRRGEGERE